MIHHYTTLDTLALILGNRTVRFNRLDRVDDKTEATAYGPYGLAKCLFVSCWTCEDDESIPQWAMYADGPVGVRVSLPRSPFLFRLVNPFESVGLLEAFGLGVRAPLPWDRMWTDDYILTPSFNSEAHFEHEVEYVDDPAAHYEGMVQVERRGDGGVEIGVSNTDKLVHYKGRHWAFQKEVRYALLTVPSVPIPRAGITNAGYHRDVVKESVLSFLASNGPKATHIDLDLDPAVLTDLVVTLGPHARDDEWDRAEALLVEHAPGATLRPSVLAGTIGRPER